MTVFREHTPKRRENKKNVAKYQDHKANLKEDFQNRCGYCNDIDTWRNIWFEIDHFVPKPQLLKISEKDYSNLVYSCRSCNNAKRSKWPTNDEQIHNQKNKGFIDPCDDKYNEHFDRNAEGQITYNNDLGEWMYNALKLYKPQHEIIWKIDKLDLMINEIKQMQVTNLNNTDLIDNLIKVYDNFYKYLHQLYDI